MIASNYQSTLTAGKMYIGGDFTQIGLYYSPYYREKNFCAEEGHTTILNGSGEQTISFESSSSHFATLQLTKPISNYTFTPNPCWTTLISLEDIEFGEPTFILPTYLTVIEAYAFENIKASIVLIPNTCTSIGAYAFKNASVTQIRIPVGCSIGKDAFDGCAEVFIFGKSGSAAETYCNSHSNCTFIAE